MITLQTANTVYIQLHAGSLESNAEKQNTDSIQHVKKITEAILFFVGVRHIKIRAVHHIS